MEENKHSELVLPKEYTKPMVDMLSRFTETTRKSVDTELGAGPVLVAVAVAVVIVLVDRPAEKMVLTTEEKAALKFAAEQIHANPDMIKQTLGIELSRTHLQLIESLAQK